MDGLTVLKLLAAGMFLIGLIGAVIMVMIDD